MIVHVQIVIVSCQESLAEEPDFGHGFIWFETSNLLVTECEGWESVFGSEPFSTWLEPLSCRWAVGVRSLTEGHAVCPWVAEEEESSFCFCQRKGKTDMKDGAEGVEMKRSQQRGAGRWRGRGRKRVEKSMAAWKRKRNVRAEVRVTVMSGKSKQQCWKEGREQCGLCPGWRTMQLFVGSWTQRLKWELHLLSQHKVRRIRSEEGNCQFCPLSLIWFLVLMDLKTQLREEVRPFWGPQDVVCWDLQWP